MGFVDITGQKFGRLTVLSVHQSSHPGSRTKWLCQCECGNTTIVTISRLRNGKTKSCGCLRKETCRKNFTIHGSYKLPLHAVWNTMLSRCNNKNSSSYLDYGGRGISVCEEWHKYELFEAWAFSHGYISGLTIERVNNEKGYNPENCIWISKRQQARNKRNTRYLSFNGVSKSVLDWSDEVGISTSTIYARIRMGWSIKDALSKPVRPLNKKK